MEISALSQRLVLADLDDDVLTYAFDDGHIGRIPVSKLKLPPGPPIVHAGIDEFGGGIEFVRVDGSRTDCGADLILFMTSPSYRAGHRHDGKDFANRVRRRIVRLRTQRGLSQRDLAEKIEMAASNYARVETGRHVPSLETLLRIARGLDVPLAELTAKP
jgi:DNA-binding XRE family transcriptional regulator